MPESDPGPIPGEPYLDPRPKIFVVEYSHRHGRDYSLWIGTEPSEEELIASNPQWEGGDEGADPEEKMEAISMGLIEELLPQYAKALKFAEQIARFETIDLNDVTNPDSELEAMNRLIAEARKITAAEDPESSQPTNAHHATEEPKSDE